MKAALALFLALGAGPMMAHAAVVETIAAPDGKFVAVVETAEGDWRTIRVRDGAGRFLPDQIEWASFTTVAWAPDGSGFYYSRQPKPWDDPALQVFNTTHSVQFHHLGTSQDDDQDVYYTDRAAMFHKAQISVDGRWLVVTSSENHDPRHEVVLINRAQPLPAPFKLIRGLDAGWWFAGNRQDVLYFVTTSGAERGRLVAVDVARTAFELVEIVPEGERVLRSATIGPQQISLTYADGTVRQISSTEPRK